MDNMELAQLKNTLRQKSTQELTAIWVENKRNEWAKEAFVIIKSLLKERGAKIPMREAFDTAMAGADLSKDTGMPFFPVTPRKLAIMSLCTFGLYEIYWHYRNWKSLKEKHNVKVSPFARAFFAPFFCYSLFKTIKQYAQQHQVKAVYAPGGLTAAYILLLMTGRLPEPMWIVSIFTFIPLLSAQKVINSVSEKLTSNSEINSKFSGLNIFGVIVGSILLLFTVLGTVIPE